MEFQSVERASDAFQESVTPDQISAMCHRAFGAGMEVVSAVELGGGLYNNTYRVEIGEDRPVILRVAPEPGRQSRIERALMRNEHASLPFFAPIAAMMPRTLFVDWTREILGRDYLWQTMLDGMPAPGGLRAYPRPQWAEFYRQLGTIAKRVHGVRGERFGPVAWPTFTTWSEAVICSMEDTAADLEDAGLDAGDVREVVAVAGRRRTVLDEIDEPRLLHGDLWVPNVMLALDTPEPTITGVLDHDRASWGDPAADWTTWMIAQRPATERAAFWKTYGAPPDTARAVWRAQIYRARHVSAVRLERHRLRRHTEIAGSYAEMREVLHLLEGYRKPFSVSLLTGVSVPQ
jgi:aminoglycoside phosphotransferase (APT) family kinase protein